MNGTFNGPGDLTTLSDLTVNNTFNGGALTVSGNIVINGNITATNGTALQVSGTSPVWQSGSLSRVFLVRGGDVLTLSGAGTKTVDAAVEIQSGAVADFQSGAFNVNSGKTVVNNGTFDISSAGSLSIGGSGTFNNNSLLRKSGTGTTNINIDFNNNNTGILSGLGTINTFASRVFTSNGTLAPGLPGGTAGTLTMNGDQPLSDLSTLEIMINGTAAGTDHDVLQRTGDLVLDGDLVIDEGSIALHHPYRVIAVTNGTITGAFDIIQGDANTYTASVVTEGTNSFLELTPVQSLPVELISFTGAVDGNTVVLNWRTATELNTKRFELERATEPHPRFEKIGEVQAIGNSSAALDYSFTDRKPVADVNFYRLKIIDNDGSFAYSSRVAIRSKAGAFGLSVYPNPAGNTELQVQISGIAQPRMMLRIHDMGARIVHQNEVFASGKSLFTSVDVSKLPPGSYVLSIQAANERFTTQFIKK